MRATARTVWRRLIRGAVAEAVGPVRAEADQLRAEVAALTAAAARQAASLDQVRDWLARLPTPADPPPAPAALPPLGSAVCRAEHLDRPDFRRWTALLREPPLRHRKQWEFCYIAQVLAEAGVLGPGRRGLGFAVGREPLAALFAAHGCDIVATDLDPAAPAAGVWDGAGQHAGPGADLNDRGICPADEFARRVRRQPADMTRPPAGLTGFDFLWSACAVEHVGSLAAARDAVRAMMRCLRPGGVAVHTTEFNLQSADRTVEEGWNVIWRRSDLDGVIADLRADGHLVAALDLDRPASFANCYVDEPPYHNRVHLNLRLDGFASTSVGLVVRAAGSLTPVG